MRMPTPTPRRARPWRPPPSRCRERPSSPLLRMRRCPARSPSPAAPPARPAAASAPQGRSRGVCPRQRRPSPWTSRRASRAANACASARKTCSPSAAPCRAGQTPPPTPQRSPACGWPAASDAEPSCTRARSEAALAARAAAPSWTTSGRNTTEAPTPSACDEAKCWGRRSSLSRWRCARVRRRSPR